MKKSFLIMGIGVLLILLYLIFIPSGIYIKPQVKNQVTRFISTPNDKKVVATQQVRQELKRVKNPKVTRISDPEGGTKNYEIFSLAINGETYSAKMSKVGVYSWELKELYQ